MQYYSGDWKLGYKSKSNMAEFSSNPDNRLKHEVSYETHNKRIKEECDKHREYRVSINKERQKIGLTDFFDNQDSFDNIIAESELEDSDLKYYLIYYGAETCKVEEKSKNREV